GPTVANHSCGPSRDVATFDQTSLSLATTEGRSSASCTQSHTCEGHNGVCLMNHRIYDVQKIVKSKEEVGEGDTAKSPYVLEVRDKLILRHFRLSMLKPDDDNTYPMEHVAAFRA
ncbi:hypothetical protein GW17_00029759, partial [Ensete ventricosum]